MLGEIKPKHGPGLGKLCSTHLRCYRGLQWKTTTLTSPVGMFGTVTLISVALQFAPAVSTTLTNPNLTVPFVPKFAPVMVIDLPGAAAGGESGTMIVGPCAAIGSLRAIITMVVMTKRQICIRDLTAQLITHAP